MKLTVYIALALFVMIGLALMGSVKEASELRLLVGAAIIIFSTVGAALYLVAFAGLPKPAVAGEMISDMVRLFKRNDPDYENLDTYSKGAEEILIAGTTLNPLATEFKEFLEEQVRNGTRIKLLLIDPEEIGPDSDLMRKIAEHQGPERSANDIFQEITASLTAFRELREKGDKQVEIKAIRGLPTDTVTMINPGRAHGKIRVELRPYKMRQELRPGFELTSEHRLYDLLYQQYMRLWDEAKEIP